MKASFYEIACTPPLGGDMPGYPYVRAAEDVLDDLYVKSLVVDDGETTIAILVIDACNLVPGLCQAVTERINAYTGIKPENVMICANHTHRGVPIQKGGSRAMERDEAYTDVFFRLVADCATLAWRRLEEAVPRYASGTVEGISFNRIYLMKNGTLRTNPGRLNPDIIRPVGPVDTELPLLVFENGEGRPMGAVINFACHQDCLSENAYTGDYSSILAKELKKTYGPDFVSLFLVGACGNVNAQDVTKPLIPDLYIRMGRKIAVEAQSVIRRAQPVSGAKIRCQRETLRMGKRVSTPEYLREKMLEYALGNHADWIRDLVYYHTLDNGGQRELVVQCIRIGDVMIYALPGEMFVEFQIAIKKHSPCGKNIIAELSNCRTGYIPTKDMFDHSGVYESKLSSYTCLVPEAGDRIVEKALELADLCMGDRR